MEMKYIVTDPTGNITVLITTPYTPANRGSMIEAAFELVPDCEQAGFIIPEEDGAVRVEMMGYEFCGNAALSTAALQALRQGFEVGSESVITISSSGIEEPLDIEVSRLPDTQGPDGDAYPVFEGTVRMPVPEMSNFKGYPLVNMNGISHLVVPEPDMDDAAAMTLIREYAGELGVPALGFMLCSSEDDQSLTIRPLVYVPVSDTLVWEHGCATGSTAVGFCRYSMDSSNSDTEIKQPGGTMRIRIENGIPFLTGRVILRLSHKQLSDL